MQPSPRNRHNTRVLREYPTAARARRSQSGSIPEPLDLERLVEAIVQETEGPAPNPRPRHELERRAALRTPTAPAARRPRPANFWVTKPILRARGWTDTAIRDFLPKPERHCENPHPEGARRPMPLWRAETIARAESSPEWQYWLEKSLHRRGKTLADLRGATRDRAFLRRLTAADTAITAHQRGRRPGEPLPRRERPE